MAFGFLRLSRLFPRLPARPTQDEAALYLRDAKTYQGRPFDTWIARRVKATRRGSAPDIESQGGE